MRKLLTIFFIIIIIITVSAEIFLPSLVSSNMKNYLSGKLSTTEVELSVESHPAAMMLLGRADRIWIDVQNAKVGKVTLNEITLNAEGLRVEAHSLLNAGQLKLKSADKLEVEGIIDEAALQKALSHNIDRVENVQVTIKPDMVTVTGDGKIAGMKAGLAMEGNVVEDKGTLYFHLSKVTLRNSKRGLNFLAELFSDIPLVQSEKMPLGTKIKDVQQLDGRIILRAGL